MIRIVLLTLHFATWIAAVAANDLGKMTQGEAERLIFQCWKEIASEYGGKRTEGGGFGYCFAPDGGATWLLQGEISGGGDKVKMIVDANANPMRFDIIHLKKDGKEAYAFPQIFKLEKGDLILISPGNKAEAFRKDGNYTIRPTGFETTSDNKYLKKILKRCQYLEQDNSVAG